MLAQWNNVVRIHSLYTYTDMRTWAWAVFAGSCCLKHCKFSVNFYVLAVADFLAVGLAFIFTVFVYILHFWCIHLVVFCVFLSTSAINCLERPFCKMTYRVAQKTRKMATALLHYWSKRVPYFYEVVWQHVYSVVGSLMVTVTILLPCLTVTELFMIRKSYTGKNVVAHFWLRSVQWPG